MKLQIHSTFLLLTLPAVLVWSAPIASIGNCSVLLALFLLQSPANNATPPAALEPAVLALMKRTDCVLTPANTTSPGGLTCTRPQAELAPGSAPVVDLYKLTIEF